MEEGEEFVEEIEKEEEYDDIDDIIEYSKITKNLNLEDRELKTFPLVHENITHLNLRGNCLFEIPINFYFLKNLLELDLSSNLFAELTEYKDKEYTKKYGILVLGLGNIKSLKVCMFIKNRY